LRGQRRRRYNLAVCSASIARLDRAGVLPPLSTRSFRVLLLWQAFAIVAFAAIGGAWSGGAGAVSGALGAAIHLVANFVYALMGGIVRATSVVGALFVILRAEGFKIGLILVQLILVLKLYRELAAGPFILAFIVTALMFGIAARVRN
jgi:F0F1-type ATP synthase assembly protein I